MMEPRRNTDLHSLEPYIAVRVQRILDRMTRRGFDPVLFEARRSDERQRWLYGVGRTHSLTRKPITWTLESKHVRGKAADIVSKSRLWSWPEFYKALAEEADREGMHTLAVEQCHVEWRG